GAPARVRPSRRAGDRAREGARTASRERALLLSRRAARARRAVAARDERGRAGARVRSRRRGEGPFDAAARRDRQLSLDPLARDVAPRAPVGAAPPREGRGRGRPRRRARRDAGGDPVTARAEATTSELAEMLDRAVELGASDLHLGAGDPATWRVDGELVRK